jgi:predicted site-specific integrase-resolvase
MSTKQKEFDPTDDPLLPSRTVRKALGDVSDMTLHRWIKNGSLHPPEKFNGRNYWRKSWIARVGGSQ